MAHIKVVRRSMRPEEWTQLRFGWLKRYIVRDKYEIDTLQIRDARQVSEMNYEYYSDEYRPLKKGDMYFTPDGTAFIKGDVKIPESLKGKELWLTLKTAAEIIIKVNGKYVGGVDPNRDRVLLSGYVDSDELHIEMQGYNRSKPDDERNPESLSVRGCRQIFEGAYLATVDHDVLDLVYDFEVLLDIAESDYFNEDYRAFLNRELNNAMNCICFDDEESITGVKEAKEYIENVIYPKLKEKISEIFIENSDKKFVFISIPLLFEVGWFDLFDKILFIKADDKIRLERLMKRNNLSKKEAQARIDAQIPQEEKENNADFIICNNEDVQSLQKQLEAFIIQIEETE